MTEPMQRVVYALQNSPPWVRHSITFSDMQKLAQMHDGENNMRGHMLASDILLMARQRKGL